jgi:ribosomal protein S7
MEQKNKKFKIKNIFVKILMKKGKKSISEKIFKNILINLKNKTKQKPNFILKKAILNLSPKLKLINILFGKRKKYFLIYLNEEQQMKISINWLLFFSKTKSKNFLNNIINEIYETFNNKSKSIEKKKNLYKDIKKLKYNIIF